MNIRKLAAAAVIGAAASGAAQAVTLFTEDFDAGNSFAGGTRINDGADDYLLLSVLSPTATKGLTFGDLAQLTLSFWYSGLSRTNNGTVTLKDAWGAIVSSSVLGNTPGNAIDYGKNNPGQLRGGNNDYDKYFTYTVSNLTAGNYTLTFSKGAGLFNSTKIDDVAVNAQPVPEPQTYALLLAGLSVVGWVARRRRPGRD